MFFNKSLFFCKNIKISKLSSLSLFLLSDIIFPAEEKTLSLATDNIYYRFTIIYCNF